MSVTRSIHLAVVTSLAFCSAGCSSSEASVAPGGDARVEDAREYSPDHRSDTGGTGNGGSRDSGPGAGGKTMTPSGGAGGSAGAVGGSRGDGGTRSDGGGLKDSSTDAPAVPDSGGSGAHGVIRCGATTCDASKGETCCGAPGASTISPPVSYSCVPANGTCTGVRMSCDDAEDCSAGEVCCGMGPGTATFYRSLECVPSSSNCTHFCDPGQAAQCGTGMTCGASTFMPAYSICKS